MQLLRIFQSLIEFFTRSDAAASGTTVNSPFPLGIGMYIVNECYRDTNQPECQKMFQRLRTQKRTSCASVSLFVVVAFFDIEKGDFILCDLRPERQ